MHFPRERQNIDWNMPEPIYFCTLLYQNFLDSYHIQYPKDRLSPASLSKVPRDLAM